MRNFKLGERLSPLALRANKKYGNLCDGDFSAIVTKDYGDGNYRVKILSCEVQDKVMEDIDVDGECFYSRINRPIYKKSKFNKYKRDMKL